MALDTTTTRPVEGGGIDLSGIDIDAAIFEATGGGYGGGRGGQTNPTAPEGEPRVNSDWVTNWGNGPVSDEFDFSTPPRDPQEEIELVAEPEVDNPLIDLLNPQTGGGEPTPTFKNGGPEGISIAPLVVVGALVVGAALGFAIVAVQAMYEKAMGQLDYTKYIDPDQMTGDLQSPSDMLADLLKQSGIEGIDTSKIEVTDILANLSGKMDQLGEIMNTLRGAAEKGDSNAFTDALTELMVLAGLDLGSLDLGTLPTDVTLDNVFESLGITGGMDGMGFVEVIDQTISVIHGSETTIDLSKWSDLWDDIA